jgi:hypothetical protein
MYSYSYSAPGESMSSLFDMNITVLFTMDREPIVTITFDVCDNKHLISRLLLLYSTFTLLQVLQLICNYQEYNYSIIIESKTQTATQAVTGPFKQIGYDRISQTITSCFEEGMEYSLIVVLDTTVGTITAHKRNFSKEKGTMYLNQCCSIYTLTHIHTHTSQSVHTPCAHTMS